MKLAFVGSTGCERTRSLAEGLSRCAIERGHELAAVEEARAIVNLTDAAAPRAHWQRSGLRQFGLSLVPSRALDARRFPAPAEVLADAYPALLRTLSNAVVAVGAGGCALVTPELGVRPLAARPADVLDAVLPLAGATFAIENDVREDLDARLLRSAALDDVREGGRRLASLGLLPSPVRMDEILPPEDLRLLRAVYGLQQISYGNVSVREPSGGFWMTARGVDKARLGDAGRDILLVTGHDADRGVLRCSVPAGCGAARVSVDALEHALVYEAFPEVGAIVHAHAWIHGIASTGQNWPCGTTELARDVLALVASSDDPSRAEIGLRNHGVTLTGGSVAAVFARVEGRLVREIPAS